MALLNHLRAASWRSVRGDRLNVQLFSALRALHKSAASEALGVSAAQEETMPQRLITPEDVGTVKTLNEMPGPSTVSNLVEFFWRDGFSRIHEIQVMVPPCVLYFFSCVLGVCQIRCVKWHRPLRKSAPGVRSGLTFHSNTWNFVEGVT